MIRLRCSIPAARLTLGRSVPNMVARNSWVICNNPESTRSCVSSSHRERRCSKSWSRLHPAVCAACSPWTVAHRLNIICKRGHNSKALCNAETRILNPSPPTCTTPRCGLLVSPTATGIGVKPSFPSTPTSTLSPFRVVNTKDTIPAFRKYAKSRRPLASCKTLCCGRVTNSRCGRSRSNSLAGSDRRIVFTTALPDGFVRSPGSGLPFSCDRRAPLLSLRKFPPNTPRRISLAVLGCVCNSAASYKRSCTPHKGMYLSGTALPVLEPFRVVL